MKKVTMAYYDEHGDKQAVTIMVSGNTTDKAAMAYLKSLYNVKRHKNAHNGIEIISFTVSIQTDG